MFCLLGDLGGGPVLVKKLIPRVRMVPVPTDSKVAYKRCRIAGPVFTDSSPT